MLPTAEREAEDREIRAKEAEKERRSERYRKAEEAGQERRLVEDVRGLTTTRGQKAQGGGHFKRKTKEDGKLEYKKAKENKTNINSIFEEEEEQHLYKRPLPILPRADYYTYSSVAIYYLF